MPDLDELFRKPPHMLPGVDVAESTPDEVRAALAEYQDLRERHREADRQTVVAAHAIEQAEAEEIRAEASALRSGGKVPKSTLAAKRAELTERERATAVLRQAVQDSFNALTTIVAEHREQWSATLATEAQAKRGELVDCVEAVGRADGELRHAMQASAWLASFPSQTRPKPASVGEPGLLKPSGDPHSPAELIDGLRVYAAGRAGRQPASPGALPIG